MVCTYELPLKLPVQEKVALNKEVLACVSNSALIAPDGNSGMLKMWIDGAKRAGIKNVMVIAIDDEYLIDLSVAKGSVAEHPVNPQVARTLDKLGVAYWRKDPVRTADKANSNHGISALKFQLIKEFLVLGYSLLLSDVDIVILKNPFEKLYRDEDVEGLSDGFDPPTAYGYDDVFDDPKMGWSRWAHTIRVFTLNSGLFYIRPNTNTIALMDRITARLMKEKAWDQAVFNEEIWFPSHGDYKGSHITVRVMDIYDYMNSKTLFRTVRYDDNFKTYVPTMIHVNYHPDKWQRMQSVWDRYVNGNEHALDAYPVGSCFTAPNC